MDSNGDVIFIAAALAWPLPTVQKAATTEQLLAAMQVIMDASVNTDHPCFFNQNYAGLFCTPAWNVVIVNFGNPSVGPRGCDLVHCVPRG